MRRTATALTATLATLALAAPAHALTATTQSAGNISDTSVMLRGQVDPGVLSVAPSYYFEYGESQGYGSQTPSTVFALPATVKVTLVGLTPRTTYHYRVVATGLLGTTRGTDKSFKTDDPQSSSDGNSGGGNSSGDGGSGSATDGSGSGSGSGDSSSGSGSDTGSGTDAGSGTGGGEPSAGSDSSQSGGNDNSSGDEQAPVVEAEDSGKPVLGSTIGAAPDSGS